MVVLRATRKLLAILPGTRPPPARSDTAPGDWYVNRLVVDRRPLLLLVSGSSLLPIRAWSDTEVCQARRDKAWQTVRQSAHVTRGHDESRSRRARWRP